MKRIASIAVLLLLGACSAAGGSKPEVAEARTSLDTWAERVHVASMPEEVRLAAHETGLSGAQARALADFHMRWASAEGGEIVVTIPPGPGGYRTAAEARDYLLAQGAGAVRLASGEAGPVVVGFLRHTAVVPDCGAYWGGLTMTKDNQPFHSFGCATAANLAAQVANPADLLGPRAMTPADAQRRDTVMGKYRAGQPTSAIAEPNGAGSISSAVN